MIETVAEIGSTNAELLSRLGRGEDIAEGHWLIADRQSAGRGRAGRAWSDGAGNFMGSTVARLQPGDPPAPTLALVAGLAAAEVLAQQPVLAELRLKWPNDLLVRGAKLGGILLERQGDAVVVGIGVNLASAPDLPDRATVSLAALGGVLERDRFAQALAGRWSLLLDHWHRGGWPELRAGWQAMALPEGTPLSVRDGNGRVIVGSFAGLEEDGAARLRLADGTERAIHAGEVELVGQGR